MSKEIINELIKQFDSEWKKPLDQPEYEPIPDGEYNAVLEEFEIKKSKAGNVIAVWSFYLPNIKRKHVKFNTLSNTTGINMFKRDIKAAGIELSGNLSRDLEMMDAKVKEEFKIKIEKNGSYINTYIIECIYQQDDIDF